jgi:cobyrinic acid a,c-diamide synthase
MVSKEETTTISMPRLMIVGTGKGVGTSTITLGLLVALKRAGVSVALSKIGNSLVDATHQRRIAGRLAHTLDLWMLSSSQLLSSLARLSVGAELIIVEGEQGLFDAHASDFSFAREADFAAQFNIPVILVIDARGYAESISALVSGFSKFSPCLNIAGVIANWVQNDEHNNRLKAAIESQNGPKYLGGVRIGDSLLFAQSGSNNTEENLSLLTRNRVIAVGDLVNASVDLTTIRALAENTQRLEVESSALSGLPRECRVAVADDAAFHLTVQDNLDLIRRAGAEIVAFSLLADNRIPIHSGALYLPSGYLQLYATDLHANEAMKNAVFEFAKSGGAIYAEGDSLAYLCKNIVTKDGDVFPMVGLIPGTANAVQVDARGAHSEYCEVTAFEETIFARIGDKFRGFREARWLIRLESKIMNCFKVRNRAMLLSANRKTEPPAIEGLSPLPHVIATALQIHWASNQKMARMFVESAKANTPLK